MFPPNEPVNCDVLPPKLVDGKLGVLGVVGAGNNIKAAQYNSGYWIVDYAGTEGYMLYSADGAPNGVSFQSFPALQGYNSGTIMQDSCLANGYFYGIYATGWILKQPSSSHPAIVSLPDDKVLVFEGPY